ncbi:MAG: hypothetical protein IPG51_19240 [Chloroflexi bacterium]|nr:hypothetical protein [Chloroflexota bacterium]
MTGPTFRQWWLTVRQELEQQQQQYLAAQEREHVAHLELPLHKLQHAAVREWTRQWEMEL